MKHNFLSPDGFEISREDFDTKEEAENFLIEWIGYYKRQGYYSTSNRTRIPLDELTNHCTYITR